MTRFVSAIVVFLFAVTGLIAGDYEAIISDNGEARAFFWEGVRFMEDNASTAAVNSFKRAVEIDKGCYIGAYLLLEMSDIRNDAEAVKYYNKIINDTPVYEDEYREVADTYYRGEYDKAIKSGEEYIDAYNNTIDAIAVCHFIGRALYFQGEDMGRAWDVLCEAFTYSYLMPGTTPAYDVGEDVVINFVNGARP